jgi:hypothetical protein
MLALVVGLEFCDPAFNVSTFDVCLGVHRNVLSRSIDMATATRPATPAINTLLRIPCAAATPNTRLAVDSMPAIRPVPPRATIRCSAHEMGFVHFGVRWLFGGLAY